MGIPGMYRWLVERYPNTLCSVSEKPGFLGMYIDLTEPNPNGVEFDNLYIDINGIIHPCFHPEQGGIPAPKSYDEVLKAIVMYINKVFSIIRPRKLLFLALDGVAPRAKMNHQRIRRFRTAKEAAAKVSALEVEGDTQMDSNVITPGTEFMELLSCTLKYYVEYKMTKAPEWQDIRVILSDSTVVGEGEYKIMSYIRSQRNLPEYDPNTRHCLHGMDADLIMLALATHEIHVSILREVITYGKKTFYRKQKQNPKQKQLYPRLMKQFIHKQKFEFFNIWVLREYLERDLLPNVEGIDFERLIDDFVFFCFFVGNDFRPRLPSLDVSEGGIELLLIVYQEEFVKMGFLTNAPEVNLKSMEHFLQALSAHENAIFYKRRQLIMEKSKRKSKRKRKRSGFQDSHDQASIQSISKPDDVESATSKVKIHKSQTNRVHYIKKFDCKSHDIDRIKRDAVLKYTEGVCWIMHYYYQGLCSWQWFYPYHYAPFASDFCGLDKLEINFTLGQPLKPFDQLLGVLPAASAQALPLFYRELMTKESSPILDFYPNDAKVDRNGKKHAWQGVCKLPFIDESRLLSEAVKVETTLTEKEKQRNRFGKDNLFVHRRHPLSKFIKEHLLCDPSSKLQIQITPKLSGGVTGYVCISDKLGYTCKPSGGAVGKFTMSYNNVISVGYKCPSHAHIPKLLCGVIMPPKILRSQDTPCPPVVWHADVSQSIVFESPTEETQKKKKRKQDDKSRIHCVDDGNKEDYGKSQVDLDLVEEGSEKRLIVEESRDKQIEHILASEAKHLVEGTENINKNIIMVNGEKPPNKMEEQDDDDDDIINHLVGKTESLIIPCAMECDLVKGQEEININCQDKSMNGFPVSEKEAKKKKKHVNDKQLADEEKTKKLVKASEKPEMLLENKDVIDEINNNNITREKETENDDDAAAGKSQRKRKRKQQGVKQENPLQQEKEEVPIAIAIAAA